MWMTAWAHCCIKNDRYSYTNFHQGPSKNNFVEKARVSIIGLSGLLSCVFTVDLQASRSLVIPNLHGWNWIYRHFCLSNLIYTQVFSYLLLHSTWNKFFVIWFSLCLTLMRFLFRRSSTFAFFYRFVFSHEAVFLFCVEVRLQVFNFS